MDGYDLHEARQVQELLTASAADALFVDSAAVPRNKLWTILSACLFPSVSETRSVWASIVSGIVGNTYPIFPAVSVLLNNTGRFHPIVTEGWEFKLWPGDRIRAYRDVATAGSSIYLALRFIEADLPYYQYTDPMNKVVQAVRRKGSVYRSSGGISMGGGPGSSPGSGGGGGGGGSEPV